ncbi:MAG: hypothetical protein ACP5D7_05705 [Limnospira sp.]
MTILNPDIKAVKDIKNNSEQMIREVTIITMSSVANPNIVYKQKQATIVKVSNKAPAPNPPRRTVMLSINKTKAIIIKCIRLGLKGSRILEKMNAPTNPERIPDKPIKATTHKREKILNIKL